MKKYVKDHFHAFIRRKLLRQSPRKLASLNQRSKLWSKLWIYQRRIEVEPNRRLLIPSSVIYYHFFPSLVSRIPWSQNVDSFFSQDHNCSGPPCSNLLIFRYLTRIRTYHTSFSLASLAAIIGLVVEIKNSIKYVIACHVNEGTQVLIRGG